MELLKFTVRNQSLSGGRNRIVSDSIDYVEAVFDFRTSDWRGLSKWAHFSKGKEVYDVNLADDRITKDMHLNLGAGTWEVKLHGTDPGGTMRITTDRAHVVVESYGRLEDGAPLPEVPLSVAEQIDAKAQEALNRANEALGKAEVSDEYISEAVEAYMKENPVEGGNISDKQIAGAVAEYIAENPIAAGGLPVVVTKFDGAYYKDKTFAEMRAAFEEGRCVYVIDKTGMISAGDVIMPLDTTTTVQMFFGAEKHPRASAGYYVTSRGRVTIDSDENVSYSYVISSTLPNPEAMSINGVVYDGITATDFTDTINAMIDAKGVGSGASCDCDERLTQLEKDVAELLYVPIAVSSFSHNAGTRENGDVVNDVKFSWTLNKDPVSVSVEGTGCSAVKTGSQIFEDLNITANRTFEITVNDGKQTAKKSTTIYFYDGVYYGCAEEPATVNSAFILSLTKKLSSGKNLSGLSVTGGEGKYFWYAYPKTMGESIFNIAGFDYEYPVQTISFTNKFGVAKDYYVYKSTYPIPGSISVTAKEG